MNDRNHQFSDAGSHGADGMGLGRQGAVAGPGSQTGAQSVGHSGEPGYGASGASGGEPWPPQAGGLGAAGMDGAAQRGAPGVAGASAGAGQPGGQPGGHWGGYPGGGYYPGSGYEHPAAAYYGQQGHPYPPFAGQYHPGMGYPPPPPSYPGQGYAHPGYGAGGGAPGRGGVSDLMEEIANGGNGLSSLTKMLSLDDSEFWKGALVGAAAVLLLTNESVQGALFKAGARTSDAVKTGIDRVKGGKGGGQGDE
ncbi:hypothetical protein [Thiococcus pfennigii]|uniref:hypothetical protein n=2 Tax=Thiococcus pfennigii TaxID=1057 RepID=UPI00190491FD|nr:hypothetical protein [Thiococcus pfennigii]